MNVLFLTTHLNTGGIGIYLKTLSKELICAGHKVTIVASDGDLKDDLCAQGVTVRILDIKTKSELSPKIYRALNDVSDIIREKQIDIIHAHTRVTQVMATLLARKHKIPYISTCHGFFKTRLSRRIFPCWGDAVIAISSAVQEHLEHKFKVEPCKIHLIENGIDREQFTFQDQDTRQKMRQELGIENDFVIGLIARLSDVKGQDILIEAMQEVIGQHPLARLVLVGQGKEEAALKVQVNNLRLEEKVMFLPTVNQTANILPAFDVFAMPSRQEGLGLSVLEAQASGVPCITSNVGGLPALIEHEQTGLLVPAQNSKALADAIVRLIKDGELRQRIAESAYKNMDARWSSQTMGTKVIHLYEELLKKS